MSARHLLAAATIASATVLVGTPAAAADGPLEVEIVGGGPLFEVTDMYPGFETSSVVQVTNTTSETGTLNLRVTDVASDDNGCNRPEARVDSTCGDDEGELADQVVLSIERETAGGQFEDIRADAPLGSLDLGVVLEDELGGGESGLYRLTLALPPSSGNETQTDSVDFEIEISGQSTVSTTDVLGAGVDRSRSAGPSTDLQVRASTAGTLPRTGVSLLELWTMGTTFVVAGAASVMLTKGRRHRG